MKVSVHSGLRIRRTRARAGNNKSKQNTIKRLIRARDAGECACAQRRRGARRLKETRRAKKNNEKSYSATEVQTNSGRGERTRGKRQEQHNYSDALYNFTCSTRARARARALTNMVSTYAYICSVWKRDACREFIKHKMHAAARCLVHDTVSLTIGSWPRPRDHLQCAAPARSTLHILSISLR